MVMLSWIIIAVLTLLVLILLWKVTKKIILTLFLFLLLGVLFLAGLGYAVYVDVNDIMVNMEEGTPLLLFMESEDQLLTGINLGEEEDLPILTIEEINQFNVHYQDREYDAILGEEYFKFITLDLDKLDLGEEITLDSIIFTKEEYFSMLYSEEPITIMDNLLENKEENPLEDIDQDELPDTSIIRFMLISNALEQNNIMSLENGEDIIPFILTNYQDGSLSIYEETITFRLFKLIPTSLISNALSDIQK